MEPNKFKGRYLVIQESKFFIKQYYDKNYVCILCETSFRNSCAITFHPHKVILSFFKRNCFCEECALKLIDNPDKVIFEYRLGLL